MRKCSVHPQLPSKFDMPHIDYGRYYQTFGMTEVIRLMQPYLDAKVKASMSLERQAEICKMFLERYLFWVAESGGSTWMPYDVLLLKCVKENNVKCYVERTYFSHEGKPIKHSARDKSKEWEMEWKYGGVNHKLAPIVPTDYDYFNVELSEQLQQFTKEKGKEWGLK